MKTIGIIREEKTPYDLRTPLTPNQCIELMDAELEKAGLYFEPATGWYGGVYLI